MSWNKASAVDKSYFGQRNLEVTGSNPVVVRCSSKLDRARDNVSCRLLPCFLNIMSRVS